MILPTATRCAQISCRACRRSQSGCSRWSGKFSRRRRSRREDGVDPLSERRICSRPHIHSYRHEHWSWRPRRRDVPLHDDCSDIVSVDRRATWDAGTTRRGFVKARSPKPIKRGRRTMPRPSWMRRRETTVLSTKVGAMPLSGTSRSWRSGPRRLAEMSRDVSLFEPRGSLAQSHSQPRSRKLTQRPSPMTMWSRTSAPSN